MKPLKSGQNLPKIVLIHGYGGGGAIFAKMIAHMTEHYEVYTIDLLGMGASGRPDFEVKGYEPCVNYFMTSIKQWTEKT